MNVLAEVAAKRSADERSLRGVTLSVPREYMLAATIVGPNHYGLRLRGGD
jgi:hypothetical protein